MSNSFAGSTTKNLSELEREIETRMDKFTDEFNPPEPIAELPIGSKVHGGGEYQQPHDDHPAESEPGFVHMGRDREQEYLNEIDEDVQKYNANIKNPLEQFPMHKTLERLSAGVDEALWDKAKRASQEAFGQIKWPFVNWWYEEHGGK